MGLMAMRFGFLQRLWLASLNFGLVSFLFDLASVHGYDSLLEHG
jgi:hypothetical protein